GPVRGRTRRLHLPAPAAGDPVRPRGPRPCTRRCRRPLERRDPSRARGRRAGALRRAGHRPFRWGGGRRVGWAILHCHFYRHPAHHVLAPRTGDDGLSIRRRRQCPECGGRFSTTEPASLMVIKRSGVLESFSRDKVISGVRKACQGRPVTDADLAVLAQKVEEAVRQTGVSQLDTNEIGLAILGPLRELDEVAYLRFASVYQEFDSLDDFERSISELRADHAKSGAESADR